MRPPRPTCGWRRQRGLALLQVLAVVALASAVVVSLAVQQQDATRRTRHYHEATQALAHVLAGELSARIVLRRDMVFAPEVDHPREPWARLAETDAALGDGATFTLAIEDAQARFNLNSVGDGGLLGPETVAAVLAAAGLDPPTATAVMARLARNPPLGSLHELSAEGVDAAAQARLEPLVTVLPGATTVNVNTASQGLLAILLNDPPAAAAVVSARQGPGFVTEADLRAIGIDLPVGLGMTSEHFWVTVTVTQGDARQRVDSLLRRRLVDDQPVVEVIRRRRGDGA